MVGQTNGHTAQSALPAGFERHDPNATVCVLTIHGIGINQARDAKRIGYADQLHGRLRHELPALLSRHPDKDVDGPLYVVGQPAVSGTAADDAPKYQELQSGLDRLTDPKPLLTTDARIAHVALVYTAFDFPGFDTGSLVRGGGRILFHILAYATPVGLIRNGVADLVAMMANNGRDATNPHPSLRVARYRMRHGMLGRLIPMRVIDQQRDPASGLLATSKQIVDDFLAYLCRGKMRDEIVDFVQEALVRIADRPEITTIVLNTHSQGTVAIFDALTDLDDDQPRTSVENVRNKVAWLITAGSPLRKVVDIFGWRPLLRNFNAGWTNFWDRRDPAADPLKPPRGWRLGMDADANGQQPLVRLGGHVKLQLRDECVSNVAHSSGGGLQAHNYWDNQREFVGPIGKALAFLLT